MNTTVEALKNTYVELGGSLSDTYEDIAGGIAVSDYVVIPDVINAIAQIAGTTIELPAVSSTDNGDVLMVSGGKWAKGDMPNELPTVSGDDNGDVLTVVEGAWSKAEVPKELPTVSGADDGSVLKVVSGAWAKVAPSGQEIQKATITVTTSSGCAVLNNNNINGATIVGAIVTSQPTGVLDTDSLIVVPSYQFGSGGSITPTLCIATWGIDSYVQLTPIADQQVTIDVYYIAANDD